MTAVTLRKLTPEEEAVFEAIIQQRKKETDDCFQYSFSEAEKFLANTGAAVRYGIGRPQQAAIIRKLTQDGIFLADWLKTNEEKKENIKGEFENDSDWIPILIKSDSTFYDYTYDSLYVINISFERIKLINDTCRALYTVTLSYDNTESRFVVTCAETGEELKVKKLKSGLLPFEVLKIAVRRPRTIITRDYLNRSPNTAIHVGKKSIATQVFDDSSVVRNELSHFVKLTNESIQVNTEANITLIELEAIKEVCF